MKRDPRGVILPFFTRIGSKGGFVERNPLPWLKQAAGGAVDFVADDNDGKLARLLLSSAAVDSSNRLMQRLLRVMRLGKPR